MGEVKADRPEPEAKRDRPAALQATLATVLLLVMVFVILALVQAGSSPAVITLWCAVILLFAGAVASLTGIIMRSLARPLLLAAIVALILTLLVQAYVPFCGDNVCSPGECAQGCTKDCDAQKCQDGVCDPKIERCDTSPDCRCPAGEACAPLRNFKNELPDERGCFPITCGDSFCDAGENSTECCADCACQADYECKSGVCMFMSPRISIVSKPITAGASATSLAGNPLLTTAAGEPRPLITLVLQSTRSVHDVTVAFSIPGVTATSVPVGAMEANTPTPVEWFLHTDSRFLAIKDDTATNITVDISYRDALEQPHHTVWTTAFTIKGRDTLDNFGSIVLFVTSDAAVNASTMQGVWDALDGRVRLVQGASDRIQFPSETLASGKGTQTDIAVLLASALEGTGMRTSLVQTASGLFVQVRTPEGNVMLDPTKIGQPYESALSDEPGSLIYNIDEIRSARKFETLSLN